MRQEAQNWWAQAEYDYRAAEANILCQQYYVAVFLSEQAAENALKALYIERK
jgi:HEPN domain-containing protein